MSTRRKFLQSSLFSSIGVLFGKKSFAGQHEQDDPKDIVLFDVNPHKKGFISPKQFIDILGTGKTLIQQTYDRFLKVCPKENIYVVTNEIYTDLVKQQIPVSIK